MLPHLLGAYYPPKEEQDCRVAVLSHQPLKGINYLHNLLWVLFEELVHSEFEFEGLESLFDLVVSPLR